MKAECTQHRGRFSEYLDGELSPRERAALEAHLEQCDHCRAELDLWRRTVRAVADLPAVGAPEEFRARVLERVRGREARRGIGRVFVRALPVAAMFLLVVGLTFMVRRDGDIARAPAPERLAMVREKAAADAAGVEAAEKGRGLPELEEALGAGFAGGEQLRGARPAPVAPAEELPRRPTLEKSFAGRPVDAMKRQAATPVATVEPMARPVGAREPDQGAFLFTQSAEAPEAVRPMPQQVLTIRWRDPAALMHRTVALANDYGTNVVLELKEEGAADIQVEIPPARYDDLLRELAAMTPPENQMLSNTLTGRDEFFEDTLEWYRAHRRRAAREMDRARRSARAGAPEAEATAPRALAMRERVAEPMERALRDEERVEVERKDMEGAKRAVRPVNLQISIRRSPDAR